MRQKTIMDSQREATIRFGLCYTELKQTNTLCCKVIWVDCISCCCNKADMECFIKQRVTNIIFPADISDGGHSLTPHQHPCFREGKMKWTSRCSRFFMWRDVNLWTKLGQSRTSVWSRSRLVFFWETLNLWSIKLTCKMNRRPFLLSVWLGARKHCSCWVLKGIKSSLLAWSIFTLMYFRQEKCNSAISYIKFDLLGSNLWF